MFNYPFRMFGMVLERVLIPDLTKITGDIDRKIVAVGISRILCECPATLAQYRNNWAPLLQALISAFELPPEESAFEGDLLADNENLGYQAAYSQLVYAQTKTPDPLPDIADNRKYLAEQLAKLSQIRPGDIPTLISALPGDHQQALQKYCAQSGVQII